MRIFDLFENETPNIKKIILEVLPLIARELDLDHLLTIVLVDQVEDVDQPTFGKYEDSHIQIAVQHRQPVDILRTLAHEMTHYKQDLLKQLGGSSGKTGSPTENEAHEIAGIIMRHIDKKYPNFLKLDSVK